MRVLRTLISRLPEFAFIALILPIAAIAQSTDQNFPTPVSTNEINGTIRARDIGDSRLTSYFYAFDGGQGDIFINVVARNFSGDIDVFTVDTLQPLTKMVIYADSSTNETGRLIYLRRSERLILRVEGRSPNDDPAAFRIKFGGSFIALTGQKAEELPTIARSDGSEESRIKVNSVGTIIEILPKPQPVKKLPPPVKESVATVKVKEPKTPAKNSGNQSLPPNKTEKVTKVEVVVTDPIKLVAAPAPKPMAKKPAKPKPAPKVTTPTAKTTKPPVTPEERKPDPLANIRLVIQLKDGIVIERPMSEVVKFSVDKGVLTVIAKDGKITRYSILDVAKVTIE